MWAATSVIFPYERSQNSTQLLHGTVFVAWIEVEVDDAVEFAIPVPFIEVVVRVEPSSTSRDRDVVVEPLCVPLWVPEAELLLEIKGVPLRPNIVVVPMVRVRVAVSPVMSDMISEVVIAVGDVDDRVRVDS